MGLSDEPMPTPPNGGAEVNARYARAMAQSYLSRGLFAMAMLSFVVGGFFFQAVWNLIFGFTTIAPAMIGAIGTPIFFLVWSVGASRRAVHDEAEQKRLDEAERSTQKLRDIEAARARGDFDRWEEDK